MQHQRNKIHNLLVKLLVNLQRSQHQEAGYSLVVTVGMVLILTTLLATASIMGKVEQSSTRATAEGDQGFSGAEAGLNLRADSINQEFEGFNQPSGTSPESWKDCVDSDSTNDGEGDFACESNLSFHGQTVSTYIADITNGTPTSTVIAPGERFGGLSAEEYRYDVYAAAIDDVQEVPSSILKMQFKSRLIPLFQFLAFYDKDLEIEPGPDMTIGGAIHTNGDLYLNAGSAMNIEGQVTVAGSNPGSDPTLYRGSKRNNNCNGTVNVDDENGDPQALDCGFGRTPITDVTAWGNNINIASENLTVPDPDTFNPDPGNSDAWYWQKGRFSGGSRP